MTTAIKNPPARARVRKNARKARRINPGTNGQAQANGQAQTIPAPTAAPRRRTSAGKMTRADFNRILGEIDCPGWTFTLGASGKNLYLQVRTALPRDGQIQAGRKWWLSPHMTRSEFLQTALLAVLQAEEHETRERFRYRGQAPYQPHMDVDALCEVAGRKDRRGENRAA